MKPLLAFLALALSLTSLGQPSASTTKPWTYWWWMGSAVDSVNISDQLEQFSKAGLGGVHIIPIYGVKGYENQFKDFLSEDWMRMVSFTIDRATSLGLGVDLSLGTGWPYGGSMVTQEMAAKRLDTRNISGKMKEVPVIPTLQKVKRAAPGGEGWVLDYFDQKHVQAYLTHFDSVFQHSDYPFRPRAFYHDSYEVYGADWTNNYPNQFEDLMGSAPIERA